MKRTALARKTPLRTKAALKKTPMKRISTLKSRPVVKRSMAALDVRWRSRAYLTWVKSQPCVLCGSPADDPHHLKGVGHMSGAGLTAPDWAVMPVCRAHHEEIHQNPDLWRHQWEWIVRTVGRAIDEGVLVLGGKK